MEQDDTNNGVRIFSASESKATERILSRVDREGKLTP
eukprot:SAG11_NODE_1364_length_5109_cov_2.966866_6_plen_37_part_00